MWKVLVSLYNSFIYEIASKTDNHNTAETFNSYFVEELRKIYDNFKKLKLLYFLFKTHKQTLK